MTVPAPVPGAGSPPGRTAGPVHGLTGVADAGAFLARLVRLDAGAPVRLRSAAPVAGSSGARTALWARLPWDVLVTREVAGAGPQDATVPAAELLAALGRGSAALPARCDEQWRWPLPPPGGLPVESVATVELARLAAAAAGTLRQAASGAPAGRAVGSRAVRDALLDHIALVVNPAAGEPVRVPQRLVQAVSKMGFLGPAPVDGSVARVCLAGRWVGISAPYGVAWLPSVKTLTVMPIIGRPNG